MMGCVEMNPKATSSFSKSGSVNAAYASEGAGSVWYPNSGVTSHVTYDPNNIHKGCIDEGNTTILAANGHLMLKTKSGISSFTVNKCLKTC